MRSNVFLVVGTAALVGASLLGGCATDPAPNFRGKWRDVNRMADAPVAIPLNESFVYSSGPQDRTLKGLLTRWAKGSRRTLSYLHSNDYTLYGPVQQINSYSLEQAVGQLNAAYGGYGVVITLDSGQITVRSGGSATVSGQ